MLPSESELVYKYVDPGWNDEEFLAFGGFVAVVLNYNKKGLIASAAQSALDQDFPCYEVLMLDDASSDGSEREMLMAAKSYAGVNKKRLKIKVVINRKNRSTIGQWQLAAMLSQGKWFGMFCGDDVSRLDRMRVARNLIGRFPTALGVGTDFKTSRGDLQFGVNCLGFWKGTDPYVTGTFPISGCAAWWNRILLEQKYRPLNFDDWLLFWAAMIIRKDDPRVTLVWDHSQVTVDYTVGTGVSTELQQRAEKCHSFFMRSWHAYFGLRKFQQRYWQTNHEALLDFADKHGHDRALVESLSRNDSPYKMFMMGWFARLAFYVRHFGLKNKGKLHFFYWRMILGPVSYATTAAFADVTYGVRHRFRGWIKGH